MNKSKIDTLIRSKLKNTYSISLKSAELFEKRNEIFYHIISKELIKNDDRQALCEFFRSITPKNLDFEIKYTRVFVDRESIKAVARRFFCDNFAHFECGLDFENFQLQNYKITLPIENDLFESFEEKNAKKLLCEHLKLNFFCDFEVEILQCSVFKELKPTSYAAVAPIQTNHRYIQVFEPVKLFGKQIEPKARYISDLNKDEDDVTVCGKISHFTERISKNDKKYYTFSVQDFTGFVRVVLYPNKTIEKKIASIMDGMEVLLFGNVKKEKYATFFATSISHCTLPTEFQMEKPKSLPVPPDYSFVFPKSYENTLQVDLFGKEEINEAMQGKTFVVFDLETTGLYSDLDRIVEIGACKVVDGRIKETFQTLVNPEIKIPPRVTEIHGINDEMVKDSITIEQAIPDFFRFCENAAMVAHNMEFDSKFLCFNAEKLGYYFDHERFDTLILARQKLPFLPNHRLETVAEHFKIRLDNHHRALDDCVCTAEILINLFSFDDIRIKKEA